MSNHKIKDENIRVQTTISRKDNDKLKEIASSKGFSSVSKYIKNLILIDIEK